MVGGGGMMGGGGMVGGGGLMGGGGMMGNGGGGYGAYGGAYGGGYGVAGYENPGFGQPQQQQMYGGGTGGYGAAQPNYSAAQPNYSAAWAEFYRRDPQAAIKAGYEPSSAERAAAGNGNDGAGASQQDYTKEWEDYYRKDPEGAVKAGFLPSDALKADVEGKRQLANANAGNDSASALNATAAAASSGASSECGGNKKEKSETQNGDASVDEARLAWEAYYRQNPKDAVKRGYEPPPDLVAEVMGNKAAN